MMKANPLYPWQNTLWGHWSRLVQRQTIPHAMLLICGKGYGRSSLVDHFIQLQLCTTPQTIKDSVGDDYLEPCHHCHGCNLFQAKTHPDFHHIEPLQAGKSIGVDQIRQTISLAMASSQLGQKRIILLDPADKITVAAENALLKVLEEPPENCYFILLASSIHTLLPTLISRCSQWFQPQIEASILLAWLSKETFIQEKSKLRDALFLNRNAPLATKSFLENKQDEQHKNLINQFILFLSTKQNGVAVADLISAQFSQNSFWLHSFLLDSIKVKTVPQNREIASIEDYIVHQQWLNEIIGLSEHLSLNTLHQQLQALSKFIAQKEETTGLNQQAILLHWLLQF